MSYYTFASFQYLDDSKIDLSELHAGLLKLLDENGLHRDVADGISELVDNGEASFTFYGGCATLEVIFSWLAMQRPNTSFGIRGTGEDLRDIWVREFSGGDVQFAQGPFSED